MRDSTNSQGTRLGRTFRARPVAIALIGVECGWLVISATGAGERLRRSASGTSAQAIAWTQQLRDKLKGMAARSSRSHAHGPAEAAGYAYAREKSDPAIAQAGGDASPASGAFHAPAPAGQDIGAAGHRTTDDAHGAHSINERLSKARERFGEALERHPLMILGLTVAAGAAISLVLPVSEKKQDGGDRIDGPGVLK